MDFERQRRAMVETQLLSRGISDTRVLGAMARVPRHLFIDEAMRSRAYDDMALSIGQGQTISQPYMVALMTELLGLRGTETVLEVGTGSGYQAAVLAELADEVYTIERNALLADRAEALLKSLSFENVRVRRGDGTLGWPEEAPFDAIIVTAASPAIPQPLVEQLAVGGVLVIPVGSRFSQEILRARRTYEGITEERHTPCVFVPLIGTHGWHEED